MEAVQDTSSLQAAIRWLLHTILPSLSKLDGWVRQEGLDGEVEGLRDEIEQVDGVVSAVNARSEIRNRSLARSLAALKELLYAADDVVDELHCYRLHAHGGPWHWHRPTEIDGPSNQLPTSSSTGGTTRNATADSSSRRKRRRGKDSADVTATNTGPWSKDQISKKIQDITGQLLDIRGNVRRVLKMLGPWSRAGPNRCQSKTTSDPRQGTSSLVQGKVYGRAQEKSYIIELITERKSDAGVTVLPIVGIAGVGKTTLAQLVYNDQDLKSQFDLRIWIWVSSSFDETRVTREMLDFVSLGAHEGKCRFPKLPEVLKDRVKSKRVLLILDDIWDDISDCQWNNLLAPFKSDNAKGSMILVTTRIPSVAKKRGTTGPINLHGLKNGDFWLMFKAFAFGEENYEEQASLGELGRQIAKGLHGNPLAAQTAGTLLREHLTVDHWNNILKNGDWKSLQLSSGIMSALKLCYDQLPYNLQQCFSYCSVFPYGYHFLAEELVRMWISQGFVKCNHSSMILEEARYYLCDLVNLGFFEQVERKEPSGRTQIYYAMCALMHNLARVVSKTECAAMDGLQYSEILPTIHHLSITDGQTGNIPGSEKFEEKIQRIFTSVAKLRTLVLIGQYESSFFEEVFRKAYNLRVLQISATSADFHSFRYSLVNLIHLRYLKLDGHGEQGSSSHQVHLYDNSAVRDNATFLALQNVCLENCREKQAVLPLENLPFLTTLKLTNMWGVREVLIPSVEELVLVNMSGLERCSCTSLGGLVSSLRVLEIRKCSALRVFDLFEKAHNSETQLKPLDSLQLHSCTSLEDLRIEDCGGIIAIEGLHLVKLRHLNVCKKSIFRGISGNGYHLGSQLDLFIISDLSLLTTSICKGLTCLHSLIIQNLKCKARRLTDDQESTLLLHKSLQELVFGDCEYLVHLPAGLHSLPALKILKIRSCSSILRLLKEELPPSLVELEIDYCSVELAKQCRLLATSKLNVIIYEDYDQEETDTSSN
ncbi:putative disease resistance protein RGA3 isoform X1 [Triticum dicoccoides]|uniref:putative disease resistance protein RGA3 isoform X1 n=1 Tax=Triticum dicoccoides TaxID=85692 RepID=UPI001890F635|nr:putative disease resistance protein RGA3 isoform X1 [Triticum dicoccoides]XP_037451290.1 putative disease resistance protein RGA3 isoform X1 [Triticum dicoccoides]